MELLKGKGRVPGAWLRAAVNAQEPLIFRYLSKPLVVQVTASQGTTSPQNMKEW